MGNDFVLKIGMPVQYILSNLDKFNTTEKAKEMILDFCKNDIDKKISNKLELDMIYNWASGSEKVKMRTRPSNMPDFTGTTDSVTYSIFQTNKSGYFLGFNQYKNGSQAIYCRSPKISGYYYKDMLIDNDGDGYADARSITYDNYNKNPNSTHKKVTYSDNNIDGKFDTKTTVTFYDDLINTRVYSETDLNTNKTKEITIWYNDIKQDWMSCPRTDLGQLKNWY